MLYAIAIGSNRPHGRVGSPRQIVAHVLADPEFGFSRVSPIIETQPMGPSNRRYANAAALMETELAPPELLKWLKTKEREWGKRRGQRWSSRCLDLDIILWSGGIWSSPTLAIPHAAFRDRSFVLGPLATLIPNWRDPITGLSVQHLKARLDRHRPCA
jgi:2-amino-4-hydroxy-6-hydroxymethyldihydropteridine diphosphokinase